MGENIDCNCKVKTNLYKSILFFILCLSVYLSAKPVSCSLLTDVNDQTSQFQTVTSRAQAGTSRRHVTLLGTVVTFTSTSQGHVKRTRHKGTSIGHVTRACHKDTSPRHVPISPPKRYFNLWSFAVQLIGEGPKSQFYTLFIDRCKTMSFLGSCKKVEKVYTLFKVPLAVQAVYSFTRFHFSFFHNFFFSCHLWVLSAGLGGQVFISRLNTKLSNISCFLNRSQLSIYLSVCPSMKPGYLAPFCSARTFLMQF